MLTIENEVLKVSVRTKGAELDSLFNKQEQLEYMWSADPQVWGKKSPVLFPVVGTLKDNTYFVNGKSYQLGRHGFARDMEFTVAAHTNDTVTLALESNAETLAKFPFHFRFAITYWIEQNRLSVLYSVTNTGDARMFFSVGGHPAFKLPLDENNDYNDYYLLFSQHEHAGRWPISKDGLIETQSIPLLGNADRLPLKKELFHKDAIVFKHLHSTNVKLTSDKSRAGLDFDFDGFPYLGIWAAKNADFVCIEPWCGIADSVNTDQQLEHKEGIQSLTASDTFERSWSVTVY
jgi:galactose mutarotase-like enzyme